MRLFSSVRWSLLLGLSVACGGNPDVVTPTETGNSTGGRSSGGGGSGNSGGRTVIPVGGDSDPGEGGTTGTPLDPCLEQECGSGQRCEMNASGEAECVDVSCKELKCGKKEECQPAPGGGHRCVDIGCDSDADCPEERFCNADGVCADDACSAESRRCDGNELLVCGSNGGVEESPYACSSLGKDRFQSECSEAIASAIGCTCEDDWDCPPNTVCEVSQCTGTGVAPTCTLPPVPFENVLPTREFRWGGSAYATPEAPGKAFPWSAQVASTPIIANLDDDNGDGKVNELDFPEILFLTYHRYPGTTATSAPQPLTEGIVRAIHGGGEHKGEDFFALCGNPARPAQPRSSYSDAKGAYWSEGAAPLNDCDSDTTNNGTNSPLEQNSRKAALGRPGGALAVGDLDADGLPEIVVPTENYGIQILSNRGEVLLTSAANLFKPYSSNDDWHYPSPAIANLDFKGLAEIVVGNYVLTLKKDGANFLIDQVRGGAVGTGAMVFNDDNQDFGPMTCVADVRPDLPGLEVVAGPTLYRFDPNQAGLVEVWTAKTGLTYPDGFCAVADVLGKDPEAAPGPDNPLDRVPEVIVVADGHLFVLSAQDGSVLRDLALGGGRQGGAPNVDDFDGDGFPEIATALSDFYTVVDLQEPDAAHCPEWPSLLRADEAPPGRNPERDPGADCKSDKDCNSGAVCNAVTHACVCLHNSWRRDTEDDSSKSTSSSVFDFNGDGAAEVVYNDECYFRVYDGATGGEYLAIPSLSRTIVENPVVADVDNDGNAEIVFVQNNDLIQCNETPLDSFPNGNNDTDPQSLPNGIEVWGDPSDVWVAARRIWNQQSYHVTNVLEGGGIPLHEPESWKPLHDRLYNTYRSQPRVYGVAPDLALVALQVSSPDTECGKLSDNMQVTVLVKNEGDLRVGPGVVLDFYGTWGGKETTLRDDLGEPVQVTLDKSLEPSASTLVTIQYSVGNNPAPNDKALPDRLRVAIDGGNGAKGDGAERECHEDNNEIEGPVEAGEALADLAVEVSAGDCGGDVEIKV
ncbi:MAG TPA: VCBS repeat-containing protein, partial [Polyangiaceae bacterium]|nr:VCBS repeat-containing protein [Polyangiaceae bacterium]